MNSTSTSNIISYLLAVLTVAAFVATVVLLQSSSFDISSFEPYQNLITTGIYNTILVSIITLLGSLILGFIFYLLSVSKVKYLVALTDVFTEIIYGTPLLVLIIVMAFLIGPAFNNYNRNLLGITGLIVYMTPYMKNVYKSAIASIGEEQYLAMDLFGFTSYQKYRYIIIPQVVRILMPPMMNNFSLIIKGSALLNVLSYTELFYAIRVAQSKTFAFVEGYVLMWVLYLLITIPLSQFTKWIERKWAL
ncbi:amino acid ABC transporter permease [Candidatus Xianfuyuplasma coldseepsis]|uniref:ABC transporter permease subunit n=1 Tax=Candidatus Xianfuyuplasma coldseepsis TaxID=2782163 RepID=A0A7L7KQQ6_9MOLU|nr:ABC transporter permease subunit [Xianfuyuplasma coldseepsis]QMS84612.1 ABC transporter permease subunit [Xianfuyuplasma coldseepsis]